MSTVNDHWAREDISVRTMLQEWAPAEEVLIVRMVEMIW
jgi:hypothetical protein